jgi:hypothetical protein
MTRSWWENEEILLRFRDWLAQAESEIEGLDAGGEPGQGSLGNGLPAGRDVSLLEVVEAFTAMRHEFKLQSKCHRELQASVEAARQGMAEAVQHMQSLAPREAQASERAALTLAKGLAALDEAVGRALQACETVCSRFSQETAQHADRLLAAQLETLPRWRRWLLRDRLRGMGEKFANAAGQAAAQSFSQILEGFRLLQRRCQDELARHGLERIATLGRTVDPSCMSVVALADPGTAPPETVVEELRPGYRWKNHLLWCAEVRAVPAVHGSPQETARMP